MADNKKSTKSSSKNSGSRNTQTYIERDFEDEVEVEVDDRKSAKSSSKKRSGGGSASVLRDVVVGAMGSEALLEMVERFGLVDMVVDRVKSRFEDVELDDVLEDVTDYLRRNPEVLVVSLGAVTVATGLLVWLNNRREDDGRRNTGGKVRRATAAEIEELEEEEED